MNCNDYFPSRYLKAADLQGKDWVLTMTSVERREFENDMPKPVVHFEETEKELVLNLTNFKTISGLYEDETDGWVGKKIQLYSKEVDFRGKTILAIRVRMTEPETIDGIESDSLPKPGETQSEDAIPF